MITEKQKQEHKYVWSSAGTDITRRWKDLYGYVPASEQEAYKQKWAYYQSLATRTLDAQ